MLHDLVHMCVVVLHAWFARQSDVMLQPQDALFAPRTQPCPLLLVRQLMQVVPGIPQAAGSLPVTQVLLPGLQQPALQVRPPAQEFEHTPVAVLHAWSAAQSLLVVQPHT